MFSNKLKNLKFSPKKSSTCPKISVYLKVNLIDIVSIRKF